MRGLAAAADAGAGDSGREHAAHDARARAVRQRDEGATAAERGGWAEPTEFALENAKTWKPATKGGRAKMHDTVPLEDVVLGRLTGEVLNHFITSSLGEPVYTRIYPHNSPDKSQYGRMHAKAYLGIT